MMPKDFLPALDKPQAIAASTGSRTTSLLVAVPDPQTSPILTSAAMTGRPHFQNLRRGQRGRL